MSLHYYRQSFVLWHCLHTLGPICKFVLRCKNIYRIGPILFFHHKPKVSKLFPLSFMCSLLTISLLTFQTSICCIFRKGQVLCILTSFPVLCAPESWSNYFFQPFSTFFVNFKTFSVISRPEINKKHIKMNKKRLNTAEKCSLASIRVCAAPGSWSKYTTDKVCLSMLL